MGVICLCTCLRFYLLLFIAVALLLSLPFLAVVLLLSVPFLLAQEHSCVLAGFFLAQAHSWVPAGFLAQSLSWVLAGFVPAQTHSWVLPCFLAQTLGCWASFLLAQTFSWVLAGFLVQSLPLVLADFFLAQAQSWVPGRFPSAVTLLGAGRLRPGSGTLLGAGRFPGVVTLLDVGRLLPGSDTLGCWPASWLRHQLGVCPVVLLLAPPAHPHTGTPAHRHTRTPTCHSGLPSRLSLPAQLTRLGVSFGFCAPSTRTQAAAPGLGPLCAAVPSPTPAVSLSFPPSQAPRVRPPSAPGPQPFSTPRTL